MNRQIRGYDQEFFERVKLSAARILARDGRVFELMTMEAPKEGYRFVRLFVRGRAVPYTWREKC
jgi:hypothetical protein